MKYEGALRTRAPAVWMAAGVWLCVALLAWFGYRASLEWQRSSRLLAERRTEDAAKSLVTALSRDMRGVHQSFLFSAQWNEAALDPPLEIRRLIAGAFTNYPYPESFFAWRGSLVPSNVIFFHRADRPPPWMSQLPASDQFPVVLATAPPLAKALALRIGRNSVNGSESSVFDMDIDGVSYQIVTRLLYRDPFREHVAGGLGFTVNLPWVRRFYFPRVAEQMARIGGIRVGLILSLIDEDGRRVAGPDGLRASRLRRRQELPLLFADSLVMEFRRPPDLRGRRWFIEVDDTESRPELWVSGKTAIQTFFLALAAGSLALGLAVTAQAARKSAAQADIRADFVATLTHELKTPISSIRALGDAVTSGRVTDPGTIREYAQLAVEETRRLARLVDNSLAYARVTDVTDAYYFEPLHLQELVGDALRRFRSQLSAKGFDIEVDIPDALPAVKADRTSIGLLLDNLIDNAIRYSGEAKWLRVVACPNGSVVQIAVSDRGVGIPSDDLRYVGRKFFRGRRTGSSGTGLGLAIVHRIVTAHGGSVCIESTPAAGTTINITLPVAV